MSRIKKLLVGLLLFLVVGLFYSVTPSNAASVLGEPIIRPLKMDATGKNIFYFEPNANDLRNFDPQYINEGDTRVTDVYFILDTSPSSSGPFFFCFKSDPIECTKDNLGKQIKGDQAFGLNLDPNGTPLPPDDNINTYVNSLGDQQLIDAVRNNQVIRVRICGSGEQDLQSYDKCANPKNVWFHGNQAYRVGLYEQIKGSADIQDQYNEIGEAIVFVNPYYPNVYFNFNRGELPQKLKVADDHPALAAQITEKIATASAKPINLSVSLSGIKPGGNQNNNYQVSLEGPYKGKNNKDQCKTVKVAADKNYDEVAKDNTVTFENINEGIYQVEVSEQVEEAGKGKIRTAIGFIPGVGQGAAALYTINPGGKFRDSCTDGFTLWRIPLSVRKISEKTSAGSVNRYQVTVGKPNRDPNGETVSLYSFGPGGLPCASGKINESGSCDAIDLPLIGSVSTKPELFITDLFQFALAIGGTIAVFIFILNGYRLLTSAGDKQKIADAREKITAAIIGLLFIIFSFVILEFITRDILRIPGF